MSGIWLDSFPPFFGVRRPLTCQPLERIDFAALDGGALRLHRTKNGDRGPIILSPGTAMTSLTYCVDSVPQNIVEFLAARHFDIWLFDWRTSPLLDSHQRPYTLDDVARYDWPAAIAQVTATDGNKPGVGPGALPFVAHFPAFTSPWLRPVGERSSVRCEPGRPASQAHADWDGQAQDAIG